jgi:hypothetical protein
VTDSADGKALSTPHMEFYEIAAFMFVFFRVANDNDRGEPFDSFVSQLKSLPNDLPVEFKEFLDTVSGIRDVVASETETPQRTKYRGLFNKAHLAVKDVLDAMAADALWDVCKTVEFDKLKNVVTLASGGGALKSNSTSTYPKA